MCLFFLSACADYGNNYSEFSTYATNSGYQYKAEARSESDIYNTYAAGWGAATSQYEANRIALYYCGTKYNDCVIYKEGYTNVYEQEEIEQAERKESLSIDNINERVDAECAALGFKEVDTSQSALTNAYTPKSAKKKQGNAANDLAECKLQLFTLYKQEAVEELKIIAAEEQAEMARRQAEASAKQAAAAQQQAYQSQRRNSRALMQQGQRMLSGACTLGINC